MLGRYDLFLSNLFVRLHFVAGTESGLMENQRECCICLSPLAGMEPLATSMCGHIFHLVCLNQAAQQARRCPMCRETRFAVIRIWLDPLRLEGAPEVHEIINYFEGEKAHYVEEAIILREVVEQL